MESLQEFLHRANTHFSSYVHMQGDSQDTVMQKKIWWLLNLVSVPILLLAVIFMGTNLGAGVFFSNVLFLLSFLLPLFVFHYHRRDIEAYALFSQLAIVVLAVVKVYLMGGMLYAGTPVYVGLIGPVYALILPKKNRAVYLFAFYTIAMIGVTLLNPLGGERFVFYRYFMGFLISNTAIFFTLYYFTTQWEKAKQAEKDGYRELDAAKTKFYTHIAHEFRTPLSIIGGMADQMKAQPEKWLEEGHEVIRRNCQGLTRLTNQLLDLSKLQDHSMPVKMVQDDIVLYLKYLVESFHSVAESRGLRLSFASEHESLLMDFDPDKIRDILGNLLSNALKYTPRGGEVAVTLGPHCQAGGDFLRIRVRDTGIGISPGELPRVFDRYYRAENHLQTNAVGSGIGLFLARELTRLLGGEIRAQSTPGAGSVFEVLLPVTRQAARVGSPIPGDIHGFGSSAGAMEGIQPTPSRVPGTGLRLLVVEDNSDVVRYLRALLEGPYKVYTAADGAEGFEKALETIPDLIISDVMMPAMDGFALTRKLKADLRTSHIPVVLLTARADAESRLEGLDSGADAYLAKPFNRKELFLRIENLIALRRQLQQRYASVQMPRTSPRFGESLKHTREDAFMEQVRHILEAHLDEEEFGISSLCKALAMSRSQLYRKFSALTDTTVNQFIQNLRLEKAMDLLRTTDLNVSEVAYDTGFKNPSHFSRAFSKRFGYAPSMVRTDKPTFA